MVWEAPHRGDTAGRH